MYTTFYLFFWNWTWKGQIKKPQNAVTFAVVNKQKGIQEAWMLFYQIYQTNLTGKKKCKPQPQNRKWYWAEKKCTENKWGQQLYPSLSSCTFGPPAPFLSWYNIVSKYYNPTPTDSSHDKYHFYVADFIKIYASSRSLRSFTQNLLVSDQIASGLRQISLYKLLLPELFLWSGNTYAVKAFIIVLCFVFFDVRCCVKQRKPCFFGLPLCKVLRHMSVKLYYINNLH